MVLKNRWLRLLAVLFSLSLVAAACSSSGSDDDGDQADTDQDGGGGGTLEPTAGFDGETITLGYITDQSGPFAALGIPLVEGAQVWVDWLNDQGGIAGQYPVELEVADSGYVAQTAIEEYQRLKDSSAMFAFIIGTPSVNAVLEFLEEDDVTAVPGTQDGRWYDFPVLLPVAVPYQIQMINGADWYVNEMGSTDDVACVLRQDDEYGEAGLAGVEFAAGELGFDVAVETTYAADDTEYTAQVTELSDAGCEVVYMVSGARQTNAFLTEASELGFSPTYVGAFPSQAFLFITPDSAALYENFYMVNTGPQYGDTSVAGMADYLDRQATYGEGEGDTFTLTGYTSMLPVGQLLEQAVADGDLGRAGLQTSMTQLGEIDLEGLGAAPTYNSDGSRDIPRTSVIFKADPSVAGSSMAFVTEWSSDAAEAFDFG